MRPIKTLNKRAKRVQRQAEALRQFQQALAFAKTERFAARDDDIQAEYWKYYLNVPRETYSSEKLGPLPIFHLYI